MKFSFFSKTKTTENTYLGLFLKEKEGVCFLLEKNGEVLKILNKEKLEYTNSWENLTENIDEVLFKLEQSSKKKIEETIFFIYSHFINEKTGEIVEPYLTKIKSLSKDLELKPIGYIECYEAIIAYLEKKEQLPITGILIELDKNYADIFVYKSGHKIYYQKISRSDHITDDLESAFGTIKNITLLPSRIIIYNSTDLSNLSTQIISYRWSREIFIQMPRVEVVNEQEIYQALIELFNEQLGKKEEKREGGEKGDRQEVMGFVIGEEIQPPSRNSIKYKDKLNLVFPKIKIKESLLFLKNLLKFPKLPLSFTLISGFFLIVLSYLIGEIFLHKADVTVFLPSKKLEKDFTIDSSTLNIYFATKSADLKQTKITTGKGSVGEHAEGEITIHNFDDKEKIFTKGTIIESDGLKFTLEEEVKVASSSLAADGSAKLPGKIKAKVIASTIGQESNLSKNHRFTIGDLSSSLYFAINDASFNKGSKREVRTVAKADLEDLKASALSEGKKALENQSPNASTKDEKMILPLSGYKLDNLSFSKEVGEEGDQVELKARIISSYYAYRESELINYLKREFEKTIPDGYSLRSAGLVYKLEAGEKIKDKIEIKVAASGKIIRHVKTADIENRIAGKNKNQIESFLKKEIQATGFELKTKPSFFPYKNRIPYWRKNINLQISSF